MEHTENVPSKKSLRKLQVIKNITKYSVSVAHIANELKISGVFSDSTFNQICSNREKEEELLLALEKASKDGKIDLLEYEWTILPVERCKITIITPSGIREYESKT